jgi:integral membrane protein, YjbE family
MLVALAQFGDQFIVWFESLFGEQGAYGVQVLRIVGIDIVLAGDNAVVIALACRSLPPRQRTVGIVLGAAAAIMLRILFTLIVQQILGIHWLKLAGGLILLWIAVKLILAEEASEQSVKSGASLWEAIRIIAIADMVMSLDNVLAIAAAAHGDPNLIIFGLLLSIPLVVGGATLISRLLTRYPILVWAGAALLGWVAGELIATEPVLKPALDSMAQVLSISPDAVARVFEIVGAGLVCVVGYVIQMSTVRKTEA